MKDISEDTIAPFEFSNIVQSSPVLPRTSQRYLQFIERKSQTSVFNPVGSDPQAIDTRDITVVCLDMDLGSADANPVFVRLDNQVDIRSLTLCADHLTISAPLHLPGTRVSIWARKLSFVGNGMISTEPRPFVGPSSGPEGLAGQAGGDIELFVAEIEAPDGLARLVTHGAAGQAAMSGQKGDAGTSITPWDGIIRDTPAAWGALETLSWAGDIKGNALTGGYSPVVVNWQQYVFVQQSQYSGYKWVANWGTDKVIGGAWPTNGNRPKLMPGTPGLGGAGGNVLSNHAALLASISSLTVGSPGDKAGDLAPAAAGTPVKSCKIRVGYRTYSPFPHFKANVDGHGTFNQRDNQYFEVLEKRETSPYPAVPAPGPKADPVDRSGKLLALDRQDAGFWLHPMNLSTIAAYARDAYRVGSAQIARPLVEKYLAALDGYASPEDRPRGATGPSDDTVLGFDLVLARAELMDLAQRMDGPNDYFGHPAGWVPGLSFQSNAAIFENEVRTAVARLYLSYWMDHNQAQKTEQVASSQEAIDKLQGEVRQAALQQARTLAEMEDLAEEESALRSSIATFQNDLDTLTAELVRGAKDRAEIEHAFRVAGKILGGIAQVIPIGQPVVGGIGQGISALANWDGEGGTAAAIKTAGAAVWDSRMVKDLLLPKAQTAASKLLESAGVTKPKSTDDDTTTNPKEEAFDKELDKTKLGNDVKEHIKRQSDAKDQVLGALGALSASAEEVDAATQKALANCPEYQVLVGKLDKLNAQKASYHSRVAALSSALDSATHTISMARLTQISLQHGMSDTAALLSPEALRYTRAMGVRALERLQRYQYYFAASYVFMRLAELENFDGNTEFMFTKLQEVLTTTTAPVLTGDEFDRICVVFNENLGTVADKIRTSYNETTPARDHATGAVKSVITFDLSERQLSDLSEGDNRIRIDAMNMGILSLSLEDVRIYNVVVRHADLLNPPEHPVNLRFRIYHDGVSRLRRNGHLFQFRGAPCTWGATLNSAPGSEPVAEERSPDDLSLIRQVTGQDDTAQLFPRPSAWATLTVECLNLDNLSEYVPQLKSLSLQLEYTNTDLPPEQKSLYVHTGDNLRPLITVSAPDLSGRQNGEGSFLRTFRTDAALTLTAPDTIGSFKFAGWRVPRQDGDFDVTQPVTLFDPQTEGYLGDPAGLITGTTLELRMDAHKFVRPVYILAAVR